MPRGTRNGFHPESYKLLPDEMLSPAERARKEKDEIDFVNNATTTKKFLDAAWSGNDLYPYTVITTLWTKLPKAKQHDVLKLFLFRLRVEAADVGGHNPTAVTIAGDCLDGLSSVTKDHFDNWAFKRDLLKTYPGIVKWTFRLIEHTNTLNRHAPLAAQAMMGTAIWALNNLTIEDKEVQTAIVSDPRTLELLVALCLSDTLARLSLVSGTWYNLYQLLGQLTRKALQSRVMHDRMVKYAGGDATTMASALLRPFKKKQNFKSVQGQHTIFAAVHVLYYFGVFGGLDHPLAQALREEGASVIITRELYGISRVESGPILETFPLLIDTVRKFTSCQDQCRWVAEAISEGLISAIANLSPHMANLDDKNITNINYMIAIVIPRCMICLPVVRAVHRALEGLDSAQKENLANAGGTISEYWNIFITFAKERIGLANAHHPSSKATTVFCDNKQCLTSGKKTSFKTCSNCRIALYCSRECQRTSWKEGNHKTLCRVPKPEVTRLQEAMRNAPYVVNVAVNDYISALPTLRQVASEVYPEIPFEKFGIKVDYSESSPWGNADTNLLTPDAMEEKFEELGPSSMLDGSLRDVSEGRTFVITYAEGEGPVHTGIYVMPLLQGLQ